MMVMGRCGIADGDGVGVLDSDPDALRIGILVHEAGLAVTVGVLLGVELVHQPGLAGGAVGVGPGGAEVLVSTIASGGGWMDETHSVRPPFKPVPAPPICEDEVLEP